MSQKKLYLYTIEQMLIGTTEWTKLHEIMSTEPMTEEEAQKGFDELQNMVYRALDHGDLYIHFTTDSERVIVNPAIGPLRLSKI